MSEDDVGDRLGVDGQWLPVEAPPRAFALVQTAVHHRPASFTLEKELAAGDCAGGSQEGQGGDHGLLRFSRPVALARARVGAFRSFGAPAERGAGARGRWFCRPPRGAAPWWEERWQRGTEPGA